MTRNLNPIALAVDGGGTRCRVAVSDGENIQRVEVGAANVSTDFDAACSELRGGLKALADHTGISFEVLVSLPAYLGLAGITGKALADRLAVALPFHRVRIADDRASALRGALGGANGFVAHCGTGSFIATQQAGAVRFAGGWGPVLGDQASAQWVGRRAMSETLDCTDGLTEPSEMAQELLSRYGGSDGIVHAATRMSPTDFGALAPVVTDYSSRGDALAILILQAGADYLSDRMEKMGWRTGLPVCLTGGIAPFFAAYLPDDMRSALTDPLGDPLTGAVALAHAFQKEIEDEHR